MLQRTPFTENIYIGNTLPVRAYYTEVVQQLFSEHRALQCGFCTPGMLMTAIDLVKSNSSLTEDDIRTGMSANLCRCTGYEGIVRAVQEYARQINGTNAAEHGGDD